jgi:hypothetical protein
MAISEESLKGQVRNILSKQGANDRDCRLVDDRPGTSRSASLHLEVPLPDFVDRRVGDQLGTNDVTS